MMTKTTLSLLTIGLLLSGPALSQDSTEGEIDPSLKTARTVQKRIIESIEKARPAFVAVGGGSGVCFTPDGWILTNHHVAGGGARWRVTFATGKSYPARRVGTDSRGDICLLKVEKPPAEGLPYRPLGDSDSLRIGERVIAIGNPFLLGRTDAQPTVTLGIISALHRYQGGYSDAIQTDAPINPGNSGGPLFNLDAEVVGINGRVAVRFGNRVNTGVGYAIPANQIKNFLPALRKGGEVPHGILRGLRLSSRSTSGRGAIVESVSEDAEKAGFEAGDRILKVDRYDVTEPNRLMGIVGTYPVGTELDFLIQRGEERLTIRTALGKRQASGGEGQVPPNTPFLGIRINQDHEGPGCEIETVFPDSGAFAAGLKPGDVILEIDGQEIDGVETLAGIIRGKKVGDSLSMRVQRGAENLEVEAKIGRYGNRQR